MDEFLNCEKELKAFEEILRYENDVRLIMIRDDEGRGKSTLLKRFHRESRWYNPRPAVCLIDLNESELINPDRLNFLQKIRSELFALSQLAFPDFETAYEELRHFQYGRPTPAAGHIDAADANISGGVVAGTVVAATDLRGADLRGATINFPTPEQQVTGQVEQEGEKRQKCIAAFLNDLKKIGDEQPVVILLDGWDRGNSDLCNWIWTYFIDPYSLQLETRPKFLVVGIAGNTLPDVSHIPLQINQQRIHSVRPIGPWEDDHVRQFVTAIYATVAEDELAIFRRLIVEKRASLLKVEQMIRTFVQVSQ